MASVLFPEKLFPAVLSAFFVAGVFVAVQSCHPNSRELHVCLNIYLEKDLPYIETIVKGQRRARVLLEDPDLDDIRKHVTTLYDCYRALLGECDTYWQLERYSRLMNLLNATHAYLCSNSTDNIKDLLLNTDCLSRVRDQIANCSGSGFDWLRTWKEILRMRVSPADACPAIEAYRSCLQSQLVDMVCGEEAARIYGSLMEVWLASWCDKDSTPSSALKYFFHPMTFYRATPDNGTLSQSESG